MVNLGVLGMDTAALAAEIQHGTLPVLLLTETD